MLAWHHAIPQSTHVNQAVNYSKQIQRLRIQFLGLKVVLITLKYYPKIFIFLKNRLPQYWIIGLTEHQPKNYFIIFSDISVNLEHA